MIGRLMWTLRLAIAELRGEWLFALGVALAVSSVLTTTSLLWGTKNGMVAGMRERLLQNPLNLELISDEENKIPLKTLQKIQQHPACRFLIPSVRRISLYGDVSLDSPGAEPQELAFLPTGPGDPLGGGLSFDLNSTQIPVPCMLTQLAAEDLNATEGSALLVSIRRFEDGRSVSVNLPARVDRILDIEKSSIRSAYFPLEVIERIEDYKEGRSVGLFGWPSHQSTPLASYDSCLLRFQGNPNPDQLDGLRRLGDNRFFIETSEESTYAPFTVRPKDGLLDHAWLEEIATAVAPLSLEFQPLVKAEGIIANSQQRVKLVSSDKVWLTLEDLRELDRWDYRKRNGDTLQLVDGSITSESKIYLAGDSSRVREGTIILRPEEVGAIAASKARPIEYDANTGEFRVIRTSYPSFRLYANELESVKDLRQYCQSLGLKVKTQEDRIQSVLSLDKALGRFLIFIIVAGGFGGIGALFSGIYLSIQRSRRQFAVLQILGIPRFFVTISSIIQSQAIVIIGFLASFLLFQMGSALLAGFLGQGDDSPSRVCYLSGAHWFLLLACSLSFAIIATLLASTGIQTKDPAVVARSE